MNRNDAEYIRALSPDIDIHGKWAFIGNAKCAEKSMMYGVLYHRQIKERRGRRSYDVVWNEVIRPNIDDVFTFTFVRNPWDRIYSAFNFMQKRRSSIPRQTSFSEYVKDVLAIKGWAVHWHFRPQARSFMRNGERMDGVYVGRYETLEDNWKYVADQIDAKAELPHLNRTDHKPYTEYYDDESIDIINRMYGEEIKALGYEYGK